jgi:hypothetical protein
MPDFPRREDIERQLLAEMQSAQERYGARECNVREYADALQKFNDFIIYGKLPEDLSY